MRVLRLASTFLIAAAPLVALSFPCATPSEVNPERVIPIVRSSAYVSALRPPAGYEQPNRYLNAELVVLFVEDTPGAIAPLLVPEGGSECWRGPNALNEALKNLVGILGSVRSTEFADGIILVTAGGNYEASLVLAPAFLRRLTSDIEGDLLIGLPNRDILFIAERRNLSAVSHLRTRVAKLYSVGEHKLSPRLFVLSGSKLSLLEE
jgi:hypothetical protein